MKPKSLILVSATLIASLVFGLGLNSARTATDGTAGPERVKASMSPLRPIAMDPAPRGRHSLPFGDVVVRPTAITAGTLDQKIRVDLEMTQSPAVDELLVKLHRPRQAPSPTVGRGMEKVTVKTARVRLADAGARSKRALELSDLNPPPGKYLLDFLTRKDGEPAQLVERAAVEVHAQNKLPPEPGENGASKTGSKALLGDEGNFNITNLSGDQAETYVAVRPNDPARVIAASNPGGTTPQAWISNDFMRPNTDVQRTLPTTTQMPADEGGGTSTTLNLCCDPALTADTLGNLWYAVISRNTPSPNSHVVINRVAAGTTTFQTTNVAVPRFTTGLQDKEMITIDNTATSPKFGMLYAVWTENPGQNIVISQCNTRPGGVSNPANCDSPAGWTEPALITDAGSTFTYGSVATAPNGDVYVSWSNIGSPPASNEIEIDRCLAASNCALGTSWGADTTVDDLNVSGGTGFPFVCPVIAAPGGRPGGAQSYVDVGPDGRVYVAFMDLRANGTTKCTQSATDQTFDVFVARGAALNAFPPANTGVRLSDDSASASNDHFFPSLTVDRSTGEVQSNFYSTKADATRQKTHNYMVRSTNSGVSYSAMFQLTTAQSDFSGVNSDGFDYGDYQGSDSAGGLFFPVWTDNRASHGGDSELYIHSAPVETTINSGPSGPTSDATPTFTFSSTSSPATFQCRVDANPFASCTTPHTTSLLANGAHTFEVRASTTTFGATYTDPTPAIRSFTVSSGYARPKSASPTVFRLVPAFTQCTSGNGSHAPPLASPSCNPPAQSSGFLTMNAPDRPAPFGTGADGSGHLTMKVFCTDATAPPCPAAGDQQDVQLITQLTDVRCRAVTGGCAAAGGTYSGKVLVRINALRMTDKLNGSGAGESATVTDTSLQFGLQCSGGGCSTTTSADAVIPGLVQEMKRAIWELGQIDVLDGGSDGNLVAAPAPASGVCPPACAVNGGETRFLIQGLFAP